MELTGDFIAIWLRVLIVILIISGIGLTIYLVINYLFVFVIVVGLSALLQKPIQLIEDKLKLNRTLAIIICLITLFLIVSISLSLVLIYLIDLFDSIIIQFPVYFQVVVEHIKIWIEYFTENTLLNVELFLNRFDYDLAENLIKLIDNLYHVVIATSQKLANHFIPFVTDLIVQTVEITSTTIIVTILTILLCKDWKAYQQRLVNWLPKKISQISRLFCRYFIKISWGYIKAQLIVTSVTIVVLIIGFYFLKIDRAFTLGIVVGLIDFIPIIGVGLLLWPWIIYCLITRQFIIAIELSIIYLIIVGVRQFLEPKLVSEQIGMNALFVISIGYLCFLSFGLFGVLFTPIMLITIQAIKLSQLDQMVYRYIRFGRTP
ncbi:AI-2E family transporter [Amphibacillus indicireducens]|uniref:Sporulation integral membrane protein YtvI n=1 Tax=Amphibacillus indicireducens TaxID=1076330 RepID=A0ABP7W0K7_9BACI